MALDEHEAHRLAVHRRGSHTCEVIETAQHGIFDRLVGPAVGGPGVQEELAPSRIIKACHRGTSVLPDSLAWCSSI